MSSLSHDADTLKNRLTRSGLLIVLAGAIVGIGCATIRVPAPKDETAEMVYLPAARSGDATRQLQLALSYRYGSAGLAQSDAEAANWLERAAAADNIQAQMMLGDAYCTGGMGLKRQPETGLSWLRKAAGSGSYEAKFYLAGVLESGRCGIPAAPAEAVALYEAAARGGLKFAAWRLARMLEYGKGVAANLVEAHAWYRISDGAEDADRLRLRMKPGDLRVAEERASVLKKEVLK